MRIDRILINYAEIALKGRNRRDFERALRDNIRRRIRAAGIDWTVRRGHDRVIVHVPRQHESVDLETVLAALGEVPGVASYAAATFFHGAATGDEDEHARIRDATLEWAVATQDLGERSFAVKVNRADKRYPVKSDDLARELGALIQSGSRWQDVDLTHPQRRFQVDIYPEGIYVYGDRRAGVGGLPVGSGGTVLSLLSGGIDSPVAAFRMAKRGCRVDFLHLAATQLAQQHAEQSPITQLACQLSRYTLRSTLITVPYTYFDMALLGHPQTGYEMVLFRRFVARIGERLAPRFGAEAMVAGDSLGQVASQTLANMVTSSDATALPILRPLIGDDKQEIIDLARRIGTYEISIQPYKDCCALISQNPKTRSQAATVAALEKTLFPDYERLIDDSLADAQMLTFDCGELVETRPFMERAGITEFASGDA
ncbi:tRNA 4-thiouridine(8) synthase ThiI [Ectothiorhodospiraceae bacterium WFHF3C12]|nr:tRNA 4-thiouridine(8) synthase ThiI [Ectothiorhodospiraceae bacterium WFHF3C12]